MKFDTTEYKRGSIANWNTVAQAYHYGWADAARGPFGSTSRLVHAACLEQSQTILDLACGTGAVSAATMKALVGQCRLVSVDFSTGALGIAKSSLPSGNFFEMDAEHLGFTQNVFDRILCQYALMFFPEPMEVLLELRGLLKRDGLAAFVVHGSRDRVPYFTVIMDSVLSYVPDIRQPGAPTADRFGDPAELTRLIKLAGFSSVGIERLYFTYEAGSFEEYWLDVMSSTLASVKHKIEAMGESVISAIKNAAMHDCKKFERQGRIMFPWEVILAVATN